MIKKDTVEAIWHCQREIEASEKLIEEVTVIHQENIKSREESVLPKGIKDAFGRERGLELGVPNSNSSMRIYNVSFDLALPVIRAHIANKKAELVKLEEIARLELNNKF